MSFVLEISSDGHCGVLDCSRGSPYMEIGLPASMTVTADTLATCCGLIGEPPLKTAEDRKRRFLQLVKEINLLRQGSSKSQDAVYCEFAAKYLPAIIAAYKEETVTYNMPECILNLISDVPYFVRYINSPPASGLVTLHAKRMIANAMFGEGSHFLFKLLLHQGASVIPYEVKRSLEKLLNTWAALRISHPAAGMFDYCGLAIMGGHDSEIVKDTRILLEKPLKECGAKGCDRRVGSDNSTLQVCSRCKSALYCSKDHQVQAWPEHKRFCFKAVF